MFDVILTEFYNFVVKHSKFFKNIFQAAALILAAIVLCSCGEGLSDSENLLTAPTLTYTQSDILECLSSQFSEITLIYPSGGEDRSPIQFYDLDGDGTTEALVFYTSDDSDSMYARAAVMRETADGWKVISDVEGLGTDIDTVSVMEISGSSGKVILIQWSSVSSQQSSISVYSFEDDTLQTGFSESCVEIDVDDFDRDGFSEFCYISLNPDSGRYTITYVENVSGSLQESSTYILRKDMIGSIGIQRGTPDGITEAVYVDEIVGDNMAATEIFTVSNGSFEKMTVEGDYDLDLLTVRSDTSLRCMNLYTNGMCVPSDTAPYDEIMDKSAWVYWYSCTPQGVKFTAATYISESYMFALRVPEDLLSQVTVTQSQDNGRNFTIVNPLTGERLFSLQVLAVGESIEDYTRMGYSFCKSNGVYRYLYRSSLDETDTNYITENLLVNLKT